MDNGIRYILRRNPVRLKEIRDNRQSRLQSLERFCIKKTQYLAEHPKAKTDVAERNIKAFAGKLKISKWIRVCSEGRSFSVEVDKLELNKAEKLDGCYTIKSNIPIEVAAKETIHDRYKDLADVEWAFRTMKTTLLHIRGIYVRKANRTKAHVFTIMLAYMLAYRLRRLWQDLETTIEEGIEELSTLCATEVVMGDLSINTMPTPREMGKELLERANVSLPDVIPCRKISVFTRKNLVDQRNIPVNSNY
jgi:transposase